MKKLLKNVFSEQLVDDDFRYFQQMQLLCLLLGATGLIMSIMNIFTAKWVMAGVTFTFFAVCFANFLLLRRSGVIKVINHIIFNTSVFAMFTYFLVTGGADGFSPYWFLLVPTCVMTMLGKKQGVVLTGAIFAMVITFLWCPWGRKMLLYPYGDAFCMRFPVVYIVASVIGYGMEVSRNLVYRQMRKIQEEMRILSETDRLTGLRNRYWFQEQLNRFTREEKEKNGFAAFMLIDIDGFKHINDTHGHKVGDRVLVDIAKALQNAFHPEDLLCRWGGEEFLAYLPACTTKEAERAGNVVCDLVRNAHTRDDAGEDLHITVSVGVVVVPGDLQVEATQAFIEADRQLYVAKGKGRDQVSTKVLG